MIVDHHHHHHHTTFFLGGGFFSSGESLYELLVWRSLPFSTPFLRAPRIECCANLISGCADSMYCVRGGSVESGRIRLNSATREVMNQVATRSSYLLDRLARRPFAVLERRDGLFDHFVVSHLRREPGARRETCGVGRSQTITPPQPSPRDLRTLIVWVV